MLNQQREIDKSTHAVFSKVFTGMNGKFTRYKIIMLLKSKPLNTLQISKELGYDYKSIQHSIRVLEKNNLIIRTGSGYGDIFFISDLLLKNFPQFIFWIREKQKKFERKKKYIA